jgi:hypothetical protein
VETTSSSCLEALLLGQDLFSFLLEDALTEERNRLRATTAELLADACNFSRKQEFDDDVCIVAVEQS